MINVRRVTVAVLSAVALVGLGGGLVALPASASVNCSSWHDSNTYGGTCSGSSTGRFSAYAKCKDGSYAYGVVVDYGKSSYAYCVNHGGYASGTGGFQATATLVG